MSGFFNIFGGTPINPSNISMEQIALTDLNSPYILNWPVTGLQTNQVAAQQIVATASQDGLFIQMPDARQVSVGQTVLFYNPGAYVYTVLAADTTTIAAVQINDESADPPTFGATWLALTDNSTEAGTWIVLNFGTLTGLVQASQLAGYGLTVDNITNKLDTNIPMIFAPGPAYDIKPTTLLPDQSDRANYIIWTGGSGTIQFPPIALVSDGFHFAVGNQTSDGASILLQTPDGALIDGENSQTLTLGQTSIYTTDGNGWYSLGLGTTTFFSWTTIVKDLSPYGGGTVILTPTEGTRSIVSFVCNTSPLTSNITIVWPASPGVFYVSNNTPITGFTLSVVAQSGSVITVVPNSDTYIFYNDGFEMRTAPTSIPVGSTVFPNGSPSAPSIRFVNDPSSGLYSPGSGQVGVTIGSSATATFDAEGIVLIPHGSRTNPSYAFASIANTGMYLDTANQLIRFTYNNVDGGGFGAGFLGLIDGTSVAPSLTFISDDITGFYKSGTGAVGFASESAEIAVLDALGIATIDGTATNPVYSFISNSNTGMYNAASNTIGFATNGVLTSTIGTTGIELLANSGTATSLSFENLEGTFFTRFVSGSTTEDNFYTLPDAYPVADGYVLSSDTAGVMSWIASGAFEVSLPDGSAGAPSLFFTSHPTTGIYEPAANTIGFTTNGVLTSTIGTTGLALIDGSVGNPSFTFIDDNTTGIFKPSAGTLGLSCGGIHVVTFDSNDINLYGNTSESGAFYIGDAANSFLIGLTVPNILSADVIYTLPESPSVNGQALTSTTDGVMSWSTSNFNANGLTVPVGAVGTPSISFEGDTTTGLYELSAGIIGFASGGTHCLGIDIHGISVPTGSNTTPSLCFLGDPSTGIFQQGAGIIGFSSIGTGVASISGSGFQVSNGNFLSMQATDDSALFFRQPPGAMISYIIEWPTNTPDTVTNNHLVVTNVDLVTNVVTLAWGA